ncbi:Hypothetical protein I595_1373 [Croceitalea dokdonensis DOKDO 023]|uniref:Uncharacterized protein n=1 Tax=Croceitalea dokdonensis DOKDO 023 TaxID=1300341 RepID=A0A0P7AHB4_9FLAO|nr:hypothetical protein [Croceitalea dokdonensis]KPM32946.1 Hypothetical protein I595_1373 [Croceitalea dokdonensis DOKDO 023]
MQSQDTNFNYKIIVAALAAVIIALLMAFYYSYAQSKTELNYLEDEKKLLVKEMTLIKTELNRLSAENEINEIDLRDSQSEVQQLLDSVGRLNFSIAKLRDSQKALRKLEMQFDSLKVKNNFLQYNNTLLAEKYERTRKQIEELKGVTSSLQEAEALARLKNKELAKELKIKSYLKLQNPEGSGFRVRSGRPLKTNKASTIEKLRGCVTILGDASNDSDIKVLYLQFLTPEMKVIEHNANVVNVAGNTYSKRTEVMYDGKEISICDAITVPEGSLEPGIYTLNVFEDERLLSSSEFQLK